MKSMYEGEATLKKHFCFLFENNVENNIIIRAEKLVKISCMVAREFIDEHNGFTTSDDDMTYFLRVTIESDLSINPLNW